MTVLRKLQFDVQLYYTHLLRKSQLRNEITL